MRHGRDGRWYWLAGRASVGKGGAVILFRGGFNPSHMSQPSQNSAEKAIEALLRQAEEAWGQQDYQKSIQLIEQASRLDPQNPLLLLQVGRAYGLRYEYAAAERWMER